MSVVERPVRVDPPTEPLTSPPRRRSPGRVVVIVALTVVGILVVAAATVGVLWWLDRAPTAQPATPSPAPSAVPAAPAAPGNVDSTGTALPSAVVSGTRRLHDALVADDLDTVRSLYTPGQGAAAWSTVHIRLSDPATRTALAGALETAPAPRPEVAYLYSRGDVGVGVTRRGTVAFFGTGQSTATSPPPSSAPVPAVGAAWDGAVSGYGTRRPAVLSFGGDPTGYLSGLRWSAYGGAQATASGTSTWDRDGSVVANHAPEPVRVVASNLGDCHGVLAYRSISWYFPGHGESADPQPPTDVCDGF